MLTLRMCWDFRLGSGIIVHLTGMSHRPSLGGVRPPVRVFLQMFPIIFPDKMAVSSSPCKESSEDRAPFPFNSHSRRHVLLSAERQQRDGLQYGKLVPPSASLVDDKLPALMRAEKIKNKKTN